MDTQNDIKQLAKKVLDMYMYKHISVGIAIALVTKDVYTAIKIKEYINTNF